MSIFGRIKDAIFGGETKPAAAPQRETAAPTSGSMTARVPPPVSAPSAQVVDVEQVLSERASRSGSDLNWRSSIVDLMKLLELDSSLSEREALARELGYAGDLDGSAEMNIWLHKRVMSELARNGGKVPASMLD